MPATVTCPSCGVTLKVPDSFLGKKVRCASCSAVFEAKAPAPLPAAVDEIAVEENIRDTATAPLPEAPLDEPDQRDDYDDRDYRDGRESRRRRRRRRDVEPHRGGLVMGLGIGSAVMGVVGLSAVCCICFAVLPLAGIPMGAFAWIMGQGDLKKMDQGLLDNDGRGSTQAGYICGIIGTALGALSLLCSVALVILRLAVGFSLMANNPKGF